jgi:hypothetical protein
MPVCTVCGFIELAKPAGAPGTYSLYLSCAPCFSRTVLPTMIQNYGPKTPQGARSLSIEDIMNIYMKASGLPENLRTAGQVARIRATVAAVMEDVKANIVGRLVAIQRLKGGR